MDTLNDNGFNGRTNDTLSGNGGYSSGGVYGSGGYSSGAFDISSSRGGSKNALGLSITSLCLGVVPIFFIILALALADIMMLAGAFVFMANICAIAGVILGILAIRRSYGGVAKALSITGIIVSGVTLLASLILACIYIYVLMEMLF